MNELPIPAMREDSERIAEAWHLLLALDFDGTLSPVVHAPDESNDSPSIRHVLDALVERPDVTLVFICGREIDDLRERVGIDGAIYSGNHGLEIRGPGMEFTEPTAARYARSLAKIAADLTQKLADIEGVLVEDKRLTLSVHHRKATPLDREIVWRMVLDAIHADKDRFRVTIGEMVYEIRPIVRWHKGSAIQWIKNTLSEKPPLVIYVGNDINDEDAFSMLRDAITIKVGDAGESAAQFLLADSNVLESFLRWLEQMLRNKTPMHAGSALT